MFKIIQKIYLLIAFLMFFSLFVKAQDIINYPAINTKTYNQYLKAEWKDLIKTGKTSLKNDIDFYYLQVRMGIAYYELKKYRQAILFFEKVRTQNPDDELIKEYLYYSYLFSGRIDDAGKFSSVLSDDLKGKVGIKENPIFNSVYVETKFDNWEGYTANTTQGEVLEQNTKKKFSYYSINFEHLIKNDKRFYWGYTGINILQNSYAIMDSAPFEFERKISQNQLYFKYSKQLRYGLKYNIALNLAMIFSDELTTTLTGGRWAGTTTGVKKIISGAYVGFLSVEKDISLFKFKLFSSFSSINSQYQIQPGLNINFYPFGNNNLYTISSINNQLNFGNVGAINEFVFKQSVGVRVYKFFIEPAITIGNIKNYVTNDAFVIYNGIDIIKNMKSIKIYANLFKNRMMLFAKYENYNKINEYKINGVDYKTEYNNNSIIGGVKWNF